MLRVSMRLIMTCPAADVRGVVVSVQTAGHEAHEPLLTRVHQPRLLAGGQPAFSAFKGMSRPVRNMDQPTMGM